MLTVDVKRGCVTWMLNDNVKRGLSNDNVERGC